MIGRGVSALVFIAGAGCGGHIEDVRPPPAAVGDLALVAEGPCPKLSVYAVGDHRFLAFGDDGYEITNWLPGERLAAEESIIETRSDGAFRDPKLLAGLPRTGRGYAPFDIELGGSSLNQAWLMGVESRYQPHGHGALFARSARGFRLGQERFDAVTEERAVDLPAAAADLPPIPTKTACSAPGQTFIALASTTTPAGGVFVGGRCGDGSITNLAGVMLVLQGAPHGKEWVAASLPDTEGMNGIVNLSLFARSENEAYLVAYEPFEPVEKRHSYFAVFDGKQWQRKDAGIDEGLMSVTGEAHGKLYFAAGRGLYSRDETGTVAHLTLPPLRFAEGNSIHVRKAQVFGAGELWVEAGYRVKAAGTDGKERERRASALFSTALRPHEIFCDASETASEAIYEVP